MEEETQNQQNQVQESQTEQQDNQEQGSKVTFTDEQQEAINSLIAEQVAKERKRADTKMAEVRQQAEQAKEDAVKKAEARAKMTAEQRAEAERKDREQELETERQALKKQQREVATKSLLMDKGIPMDMLPLVMGTDDEDTQNRLNLLSKYTQGRIEEETQKLMKGKQNPTAGNGGATVPSAGNPWAKGSFNLTKQQQILNQNPEQARQLISQAQPTGFYFK